MIRNFDIFQLHKITVQPFAVRLTGSEIMARMSNKRRLEWSFFLNDRSRITYNELCRKCQHECKQSFRAVVVDCPKYLSKRSKKKDKTAGNGKIP